jgi:hypothetical protein
MAIIGFLALVAIIVIAITVAVPNGNGQPRLSRADRKVQANSLATAGKMLVVAQEALMKIAADDSGNPALDAKIALGEIAQINIKALESK